jgi:hypothetical protein
LKALCIIYNHRFDANISKLEKFYQNRFEHIFHLVPYYDGALKNVIPVFEKSFYFQAHVITAWCHLKNKGFEQFVFVGDDLLLHPKINEKNISSTLNLELDMAFLPWYWGAISDLPLEYSNLMPAWNSFYQRKHLKHHALDWRKALPSYSDALNKLNQHGFHFRKLSIKNLKGYYGNYRYKHVKNRFRNLVSLFLQNKRNPPYPIVAGYADLFVLPTQKMEEVVAMLETFRDIRLWVEFAIPTTVLLSFDKIRTENDLSQKGILPIDFYKSAERVDYSVDREKAKIVFNKIDELNFNNVSELFEESDLYIHPVKLSKVSIDKL